jgi:hypothetical protein
MVTPQPIEDEPTVPALPPVATFPMPAEPAPAEPIDELAESWVPPWEQLAEEAVPPLMAAGPTDETIVHRPAVTVAETQGFLPVETPAQEILEPEPEPVASPPVRYMEPTTDVLEEVPDWLRTPAPRQRTAAPEPAPEPEVVPEAAPEEAEIDVPDWLVAPAPVAASASVEPAVPAVAALPAVGVAPPPVLPVPAPAPVEAALPAPAPAPLAPILAEPVAETRRAEPVPPLLPPAAPAVRPPLRAPKPKAAAPGLEDKLVEARHALAMGDYRRAASGYATVIKRKYQLDEVTSELELALSRNPKAAPLWQALGDAYMKDDRLPDAISAYERGMAAA